MNKCFRLAAAVSLGLAAVTAPAADDLPRAYGPFHLGMTLGEFRKLTGAAVFGAQSGDTISTLKSESLEKYVPAKNRVRERNAGFIFAGKDPDSPLYQIGYTPDETNLEVLKTNFARFGAPQTVKLNQTDRSALEWCQQGKTRVMVAYRISAKRPVSVTLEDLEIMVNVLREEGQSLDRATCGKWP
jgi:hypothetical protein